MALSINDLWHSYLVTQTGLPSSTPIADLEHEFFNGDEYGWFRTATGSPAGAHLADMRYAYFGGGVDAQYQWLLDGGAGLPAPLDDAVLLLRASQFNGADGDDWANEGTGGSALDAVATGTPHYVDDANGIGFEMCNQGDPNDDHYSVFGDQLEPGSSSFTAFARIRWTAPNGAFDNIMSKITSSPAIGSGGSGWQLVEYSALGGPGCLVSDGGLVNGTDNVFAFDNSMMSLGEHLLVMRLDRATQLLTFFLDGAEIGSASTTGVGPIDTGNDHELIFSRGQPQIGRAYGWWGRALTDVEIADLSTLFPLS